MLHSLALVEVEDGAPKHFLESLFQVTLVDCDLPAQLLYSDGFANMLQQHFPRLYDLLPVGFVCKKLATERLNVLFTNHAIHAIQQKHLHLRVNENIFEATGITII